MYIICLKNLVFLQSIITGVCSSNHRSETCASYSIWFKILKYLLNNLTKSFDYEMLWADVLNYNWFHLESTEYCTSHTVSRPKYFSCNLLPQSKTWVPDSMTLFCSTYIFFIFWIVFKPIFIIYIIKCTFKRI